LNVVTTSVVRLLCDRGRGQLLRSLLEAGLYRSQLLVGFAKCSARIHPPRWASANRGQHMRSLLEARSYRSQLPVGFAICIARISRSVLRWA
jgi:hypothetical protein